MTKFILEEIDEALMKDREEGLKVEGFKERLITTLFGDVRIRRRLYRDNEDNYCFLLDKAIGLKQRSQASPRVEELASFLSSHLPFKRCEEILRTLLPDGLSHPS